MHNRGGTLRRSLLLALLGVALWALPAQAQALDCLIYPYVTVSVSFSTDGVLDKVTVDRGDLVKEGQVLATLESSVAKAAVALAAARARLEPAMTSNQVRLDFCRRQVCPIHEMF